MYLSMNKSDDVVGIALSSKLLIKNDLPRGFEFRSVERHMMIYPNSIAMRMNYEQ